GLYRIVANSAMTQLRRRRRFGQPLLEAPGESPSGRPASAGPDFTERAADRDVLERALGALPWSLRSVVMLKDVYGLSCREIGDAMHTSEGAIKVRLHRARRRLRESLAGGTDGEV